MLVTSGMHTAGCWGGPIYSHAVHTMLPKHTQAELLDANTLQSNNRPYQLNHESTLPLVPNGHSPLLNVPQESLTCSSLHFPPATVLCSRLYQLSHGPFDVPSHLENLGTHSPLLFLHRIPEATQISPFFCSKRKVHSSVNTWHSMNALRCARAQTHNFSLGKVRWCNPQSRYLMHF